MGSTAHGLARAVGDQMLALSIRQPWARLILVAGKDVENRDWPTRHRGRILIHAAQSMTRGEWEDAITFSRAIISRTGRRHGDAPCTLRSLGLAPDDLQRGGIIGSVDLVDCATASDSPWFMGRYGFVLRNPKPLPFTPWKGQLGFFDVPELALRQQHIGSPNHE